MMATAILIDDERKGRMALRQKLQDFLPQVELLGEAESGEEGMKLIASLQPQIVFLDIEMPEMNGFEMLKRIDEKKFHIIFTTAYDHYAIKAIKYAAFDYLLKPIDIEELKLSIARVLDSLLSSHTTKKLEVLEQNFQGRSLNKIAIPTVNELLFFNISDIIHLEAQSNYTVLYFVDHPKLVASRTLKDFEELLPADIFFRSHASHLVNLNYIKRYIKGDGGQIEMQDGSLAVVSRRKKDEFLRVMGY